VDSEHAFPEKGVLYLAWEMGEEKVAPDQGDGAGVSANRAGVSGGGSKGAEGDFDMEYMEDGNSVFNRDPVTKALDNQGGAAGVSGVWELAAGAGGKGVWKIGGFRGPTGR
jgi:hypothetical protein